MRLHFPHHPRRLSAKTTLQNRQRGVSLMEVMIALLVLSIGLLGVAGLQGTALSKTREASVRTNAMSLAQDLMDGIRTNRDGALANYAINVGADEAVTAPTVDCYVNNCSPADLAQFQLYHWWKNIGDDPRFNDGAVSVTVDDTINGGASSLVTVAISWVESKNGQPETITYRMKSLIPSR